MGRPLLKVLYGDSSQPSKNLLQFAISPALFLRDQKKVARCRQIDNSSERIPSKPS
jgi:hypothetical protein